MSFEEILRSQTSTGKNVALLINHYKTSDIWSKHRKTDKPSEKSPSRSPNTYCGIKSVVGLAEEHWQAPKVPVIYST